jgi:phosphate starvation-inducible membrane PsiE
MSPVDKWQVNHLNTVPLIALIALVDKQQVNHSINGDCMANYFHYFPLIALVNNKHVNHLILV